MELTLQDTIASKKKLIGMYLPIQIAIYVPSTKDANVPISKEELQGRVDEVRKYLASMFGGFSSEGMTGGYVSTFKELIKEDVVRVVAFSTKEAYEDNKRRLITQISKWAKEWSQEAIGVEFENDLYYINQAESFKDGGKVEREESNYLQGYNFKDYEDMIETLKKAKKEKYDLGDAIDSPESLKSAMDSAVKLAENIRDEYRYNNDGDKVLVVNVKTYTSVSEDKSIDLAKEAFNLNEEQVEQLREEFNSERVNDIVNDYMDLQREDAEETLKDFINLEICKDEVLFGGRSGGYLIFQEYDFFDGKIELLEDYIYTNFNSIGEFESNSYGSFEQFIQENFNEIRETIGLINYYEFAFGVFESYVKMLVKGTGEYAQEELDYHVDQYIEENIKTKPKKKKMKKVSEETMEMGGTIDSERRFTEADFNKLVDSSDLKGKWNGFLWEIIKKDGGGYVYGKFNPKSKVLFITREKDLTNPLVLWLQQNSKVSFEEYQKLGSGGNITKNWDEFGTGGSIDDELKNFDINNLDAFERKQYDHLIKQSSKEEVLQILINSVESDYSQLSPELAEIAEKQNPTGYNNGGLIIDENWGNDGSTPSNNKDYNALYEMFPDNHAEAKAIWNQLSEKQKEGFIYDLEVTDAASEHIAESWLEFINASSQEDYWENATNWDEMKDGGGVGEVITDVDIDYSKVHGIKAIKIKQGKNGGHSALFSYYTEEPKREKWEKISKFQYNSWMKQVKNKLANGGGVGESKYKNEDLLSQKIFRIEYFNWLSSWEQFHLINKYNLDENIRTKFDNGGGVSEQKNIARQLEIVRLSSMSLDELLEEAGMTLREFKEYHLTREALIKDLSEPNFSNGGKINSKNLIKELKKGLVVRFQRDTIKGARWETNLDYKDGKIMFWRSYFNNEMEEVADKKKEYEMTEKQAIDLYNKDKEYIIEEYYVSGNVALEPLNEDKYIYEVVKDATEHLTNESKHDTQEKYNNSDKYNYTEFCDKCGRGIKGEPAFFIHMVAPDYVVPNDKENDKLIEEYSIKGVVEDLGWHPIGSECVKAYPKKYHYPTTAHGTVFVNDDNDSDDSKVKKLVVKFEKEKESIALYVIADLVSEHFMRKDYDKNIVWDKLTDEQKVKYNEDYKVSKNDFEKHIVYEFVKLYYSSKKIKERCKGQSKQTIESIKSVMYDIAKEYDTDKFPKVSKVERSVSDEEKPKQEVAKEIRTAPIKDVSDELINQAITEVLLLPKYKYLDKDEADFLYMAFANYENQKNNYGDYVYEIKWRYEYGSNDDKAKEHDEKLKKFIEGMDKANIIMFSNYDGTIEADKAVIDFINSVRGRVYTLKNKSVSTDLFPETDITPKLTAVESKRTVLMTILNLYTKTTDKEKKEKLWAKVQEIKQQIKGMENQEFKHGGDVKMTKSDMLKKLHSLSKHKNSKTISDKYEKLNAEYKSKTGVDFEGVLKGGKADGMDEASLAKKHGVSVAAIRKQLEKGIQVEREHIDNPAIQREIALDHIEEFVDYYDRLEKMERQASVKHTVKAIKGLSKSQINSISNYMKKKGFDNSDFDVYDNGMILIYKDVDSKVYKEISMFIKNNVI